MLSLQRIGLMIVILVAVGYLAWLKGIRLSETSLSNCSFEHELLLEHLKHLRLRIIIVNRATYLTIANRCCHLLVATKFRWAILHARHTVQGLRRGGDAHRCDALKICVIAD